MANLGARLANNGIYYVTGGFDEVTNAPASIHFSKYAGTNTYINTSSISTATLNTFTIETWFNIDAYANSSTDTYMFLDAQSPYASPTANGYKFYMDGILSSGTKYMNSLRFSSYRSGAFAVQLWANTANVTLNSWNHVSVSLSPNNVSGNVAFMFFNGTRVWPYIATATTTPHVDTANTRIGVDISLFSNLLTIFPGNIAAIRVSNGTIYSANYTPDYAYSTANTANTLFLFKPYQSDFSSSIDRSSLSRSINYINYSYSANNIPFITTNIPVVNSYIGTNTTITKLYSNGVLNTIGNFDEVTLPDPLVFKQKSLVVNTVINSGQMSYLSSVSTNQFAANSGPVTIEAWVLVNNVSSTAAFAGLFGTFATNGWGLYGIYGTGADAGYFRLDWITTIGGVIKDATTLYFPNQRSGSLYQVQNGVWNHIVYQLDINKNAYYFLNGGLCNTFAANTNYPNQGNFAINSNVGRTFSSFITEANYACIRISNTLVYSGTSFTPNFASSIKQTPNTTFLFAPSVTEAATNLLKDKVNTSLTFSMTSPGTANAFSNNIVYNTGGSFATGNNQPTSNPTFKAYSNGTLAIINTGNFDEVSLVPISYQFQNSDIQKYIANTALSNILLSGAFTFTIEGWVYFTGVTTSSGNYNPVINNAQGDISASTYTGWEVYFNQTAAGYANTLNYSYAVNGVTAISYSKNFNTITPNTWIHFAIQRVGSNTQYQTYINGNSTGTDTTTATAGPYASGQNIRIGQRNTTTAVPPTTFNGYIAGLRIRTSQVYTANFTPSFASSMANTADTVFLYRPVASDFSATTITDKGPSSIVLSVINANTASPDLISSYNVPGNAAAVFL